MYSPRVGDVCEVEGLELRNVDGHDYSSSELVFLLPLQALWWPVSKMAAINSPSPIGSQTHWERECRLPPP